ncbi:DUF6131 family protein [Antrihabitans sp. YC2-6]|uniref:DUF6131 family protein n=1 Tax=Antrihabitans sp. YC2-6 TaxID=2799498 RepID=UPI0018F728BB|nr:DUF6131 family protein [Antrihabitans sp. YC2-6]MBJ8346316.1 hypothetical protein [Antrihabitans sp. YC2-6]
MIAVGILLMLGAWLFESAILWAIGIVLVLAGLATMALGRMGRPVGPRVHYY